MFFREALTIIFLVSTAISIFCFYLKMEGKQYKQIFKYSTITIVVSFILRLIIHNEPFLFTFGILLIYEAMLLFIGFIFYIIYKCEIGQNSKGKENKNFILYGIPSVLILFFLIVGTVSISKSGQSVEAKKQSQEVKKQARLKKINEFKVLDKDDLGIASDTERTDSYSLDSDDSGKTIFKFKVGENVSLKLSNYKYNKINNLGNGRINIEMNLANKNEDYRIVTLYIFQNNKKYKTIDLEIENRTTSYVNKQNAKDEAEEKQEEAKEKAKKQKKEQEEKKKQADEEVASEGEDALVKAKEYAEEQSMSKAGVYDQLTSDYGEQFSAKAAQYAINRLEDVDWKENALDKAQEYKAEQNMSKNEAYDQLTSSYGEKFTPSEAQYAIDNLY